jgi:hypothetical protein
MPAVAEQYWLVSLHDHAAGALELVVDEGSWDDALEAAFVFSRVQEPDTPARISDIRLLYGWSEQRRKLSEMHAAYEHALAQASLAGEAWNRLAAIVEDPQIADVASRAADHEDALWWQLVLEKVSIAKRRNAMDTQTERRRDKQGHVWIALDASLASTGDRIVVIRVDALTDSRRAEWEIPAALWERWELDDDE